MPPAPLGLTRTHFVFYIDAPDEQDLIIVNASALLPMLKIERPTRIVIIRSILFIDVNWLP